MRLARVAVFQAPLLPVGSMAAIELIAERVRRCEATSVAILCCPEAILGGLADQAERPADLALNLATGELERVLQPLPSATVTTLVGFTESSLLVFNGSAWHGHGLNTTGEPRRSIQGFFIPRDGQAGTDFAARMSPETRARLSPLAHHVLAL